MIHQGNQQTMSENQPQGITPVVFPVEMRQYDCSKKEEISSTSLYQILAS